MTSWGGTPLSQLAKTDELRAFIHNGFWQPMDTLREKIYSNNYGILEMRHGKLGKP